MRIGILGGTFNPIHRGHLTIADAAYRAHRLKEVIFVPVNLPPHKTAYGIAAPLHRYQMVSKAIQETGHFTVSDVEINRNGKSFTIDTVRSITGIYGKGCQIYLIIGADSLNDLSSWKDIDILAAKCNIVAVNRPGFSVRDTGNLEELLGSKAIDDIMEMSVDAPPADVSSTTIRDRLKNGLDVSGMMPLPVEKYITEHGLYGC